MQLATKKLDAQRIATLVTDNNLLPVGGTHPTNKKQEVKTSNTGSKTMTTTAQILRDATGGNAQTVAFYRNCTRQFVERQWETDYKNWLDKFDEWLSAYANTDKASFEIITNFIEFRVRELWRKIRGNSLPFPIEQEIELIQIKNRLDVILAR